MKHLLVILMLVASDPFNCTTFAYRIGQGAALRERMAPEAKIRELVRGTSEAERAALWAGWEMGTEMTAQEARDYAYGACMERASEREL